MLFMKGTPDAPQCGFSSKLVNLLKQEGTLSFTNFLTLIIPSFLGVKFSSFNILSDEEVRQGLKEFSNWPTFPQLYISGKLVGGLDIVKELIEVGRIFITVAMPIAK